MNHAWFHMRTSWRNRLGRAARKLKQPKYLLGILFAVGYFSFFVGMPLLRDRLSPSPPTVDTGAEEARSWVIAGMMMMLTLVTLRQGGREGGLPFPKPELLFLISAPLSRRDLVRFFLTMNLPGLVLSALFFGLLSLWMRGSNFLVGSVVAFAGLYTLMSFTSAVRLLTSALKARGLGPLVTHLPFNLAASALVVALVLAFRPYEGGAIMGWVREMLARQPLAAALWPFMEVARAFVAPSLMAALPVLLGLAGMSALLQLASLWRPPAFEEESLRFADRIEAIRAGGLEEARRQRRKAKAQARGGEGAGPQPLPFRLAPTGSPAMAIVWKNIIGLGRRHSLRNFVLALVLLTIGASLLGEAITGSRLPMIAAGSCVYLVLLFVMISLEQRRYDLRLDIPHFAMFKSLPISATQLLHGETLGLAMIAAGQVTVGLTVAAAVLTGLSDGKTWYPVTWGVRAPILLSTLLLAWGALYAYVAIGNLIALVWPAWTQIGPKPQVGFAQFGTNMLSILLRMIFATAASIPAFLVGGMIYALFALPTSYWYWSAVPAAAAAAACFVLEAQIGFRMAAGHYRKFDMSQLKS